MSAAPKFTPGPDALRFAAEWLRAYDDTHDGGEQTAEAARVADWLDAQAEAQEWRDVAKKNGIPVRMLRAKAAQIARDNRAALAKVQP